MLLHWIIILVFLPFNLEVCQAVQLGEEELEILQEILDNFGNFPTDGKYDNVMLLPATQSAIIPKVFIWCPIQHFNVPIVCPIHKCPFIVTPLGKASKAYTRTVYDIGGNILLVQTVYRCPMTYEGLKNHKYLSAAKEILELLPAEMALRLPLFLHHKSGFSNDLLDFLIVHICQGDSLMAITEAVASINYRNYVRRNAVAAQASTKEFHDNMMYSVASNDKLMHVFLWYFEQKKASYQSHMNTVTGTTLVCDCSFILGKKVVFKGSNEKSSSEASLDNMFIGLNENGEVMEWKMGKFVSFEDMRELLKTLKQRLESNNKELSLILIPDCCASRHMYQKIFPDVQVKMGIVHAIQGVMSTLPKDHPDTQAFLHKFVQIFNGDTANDDRSEETPSALIIEANLNVFLRNLKGTLSEATFEAIENLRWHIKKGCLSGIPPGEGTEKIDNLHRHIQKCYLSRLTVVTPEMAMAVLACMFYTWNCRKKILKHYKGHKAVPIVPVEAHEVMSANQSKENGDSDVKSKPHNKSEPLVITCQSSQAEGGSGNTSVLVITSDVISYMFARLMHIQELIAAFKEKCQDKTFDVSTFPILSSPHSHSFDQTLQPDSSETAKNTEILKNNLSDFGLEIDNVPGDGNCLFGSVILQVNKLAQSCADLALHFQSIGLGKSLEEDVAQLRELCVTELETNQSTYKDWISMSNHDLKEALKQFKKDGFFASDIGDLCIKVCVNQLQVPVIVVTSLPRVPYYPFLPIKFTTAIPVYVAFNHSSPGHYDGTKETDVVPPGLATNKCYCGKNSQYTDKPSCMPGADTKCPCAKAGLPCRSSCRCITKNCLSQQKKESISCSCAHGMVNRARTRVACSKTATRNRCRCVKFGIACTLKCSCGSCGNDKPVDESLDTSCESEPSPSKKRRRRSSIYKMGAWGSMDSPGDITSPDKASTTSDTWTEQEVICIMVCREVLEACKVEPRIEHISQIYRHLARLPSTAELGLSIGMKDDTQILTKFLALQSGKRIDEFIIPTSQATNSVSEMEVEH